LKFRGCSSGVDSVVVDKSALWAAPIEKDFCDKSFFFFFFLLFLFLCCVPEKKKEEGAGWSVPSFVPPFNFSGTYF
jgi:hypothetical protein